MKGPKAITDQVDNNWMENLINRWYICFDLKGDILNAIENICLRNKKQEKTFSCLFLSFRLL